MPRLARRTTWASRSRRWTLEVKGLVEVDEQGTTLVLPSTGAAVDPTALSTFRVSFAAVPALPAEVTPEPPPEPKKPRARPKCS